MATRMLRSEMCKQAVLESETFQRWAARLGERPGHMHRKVWEFCYICQALDERGMLGPGKRGLGFAVGREPLPALFVRHGCEIVATDVRTEDAGAWATAGMHADSLEALNARGLCDAETFRQRASFRFLDMRALPRAEDLGTFDFIWSACAIEHLGSLAEGEQFIYNALRFLKPGGVAVHTTEYNVRSNDWTLSQGSVVLYRRQDLERIGRNVGPWGWAMDLDFADGDRPGDRVVDQPPFTGALHLKLNLGGFTATSFGLIVGGETPPGVPRG